VALAIATNNAALNAAASASSVNRDMETSMARLSSGKRINSASDDAAGVAISSRLSAEIRGTDQAIRNSLDGQALIDTAEGAHKEIENILQRMREVAVQAANDTNNSQDRSNLQAEMDAMINEIDRIAETTTWAGTNLMKDSSSDFKFQVGTATGTKNQILVEIGGMTASDLNLTDSAEGAYSAEGKISVTSVATQDGGTSTAPSVIITEGDADDNAASISIAALAGDVDTDAATHTISLEGISVNLVGTIDTDIGTINAAFGHLGVTASPTSGAVAGTNYAAGDDQGDTYIDLTFTDVNSPENLSVMSTNAQNLAADASNDTGSTTDADANARSAITNIDTAIMNVNIQRSELGAVSNRLNHTVNNLTNISSNLSAAKGGIEDADFALETTNLAKNQILQQASTAMLAQANASKQNVLSLLQG
jgi:flagellin